MALSEHYAGDDLHPIDIVEDLASHHQWDFERISEEQITMTVEGQWRNYALTLAWSAFDETLRLICAFDMEPPEAKLPRLYELLNCVNHQCWAGGFAYWADQQVMVYRYGLVLTGGHVASPDQIDTMVGAAVLSAERYYPAVQLVVWGDQTPAAAMQVAIAEAYGRA